MTWAMADVSPATVTDTRTTVTWTRVYVIAPTTRWATRVTRARTDITVTHVRPRQTTVSRVRVLA